MENGEKRGGGKNIIFWAIYIQYTPDTVECPYIKIRLLNSPSSDPEVLGLFGHQDPEKTWSGSSKNKHDRNHQKIIFHYS